MRRIPNRFDVRLVDPIRRVYRLVASFDFYTDACIAADFGVAEHDADFTVWDSDDASANAAPLYDSRRRRVVFTY